MWLKIQVFWDVTPYRLVNTCRRFELCEYLHAQNQAFLGKYHDSQKSREIFNHQNWITRNKGSSVGIATRYGLDGPGVESRSIRDFPHLSRPAPRPTQPPIQWIPGLSWVKDGRGVVLTTYPRLLCQGSRKRVELYLYSPYEALAACNRMKPDFTYFTLIG